MAVLQCALRDGNVCMLFCVMIVNVYNIYPRSITFADINV